MAEETPRLGMPYIRAFQAQKEVTHNMALNALDVLVQAAVESRLVGTPPATPADGQIWIVAAAASGAWAGRAGQLAQFIGGGWAFYQPRPGIRAWLKDEALEALYSGSAWVAGEVCAAKVVVNGVQVVGGQQAAIVDASGGAIVDGEARAALNALLAACRAHGLIAGG